MPGLAKTLMVSSIAKILDVGFKRIQFTPDLMPSDITGTNVLEEPEAGRRAFRFVPGPIFSNIILADEINRTPPKTQAALLAGDAGARGHGRPGDAAPARPVLRHRHAEPDRAGRDVPAPRGAARPVHVRHPGRLPALEEEEKILSSTTKGESVELNKVLSGKAIVNLQKLVTSVPISDYTIKYVTRWSGRPGRATRSRPQFIKDLVDFGAGPRAGQYLILAGKAMAAMDGRFSVSLDDIRKVAIPVLRHRISTNFQAQAEGQTTESLVKRLLAEIQRARSLEVRPPRGRATSGIDHASDSYDGPHAIPGSTRPDRADRPSR